MRAPYSGADFQRAAARDNGTLDLVTQAPGGAALGWWTVDLNRFVCQTSDCNLG